MLSTSSQCVQFEESIGRGNHASIDSADNKQSNLLSFRIAIQPLQHQQSAGGERMGYIATINGIGIHFITAQGKSIKSWSVPPSVQFATPAVSLATDDDEDQLLFVVVNEGQPSHAQSVTSVAGGKKKPLAKKSQRKSATGNVAQQQSIWSWKMSTEMGALDRLASKYPIATDRSSSPIVSLYALSSSRLVCVHSDGRLTLLNDRTDLVASTSAEGASDNQVIYTQQLEDSVLVLHKQQQEISCKIYSIINSVIKTQCHVSVPSFPPLTGEDKIIGVSYEPTERHLTILFNNSKWFVFQLAGDFSAIELHSCLHLRNIRFTKPTAIVPLSPSYAAMIVRGSITVWNYENGTPFARRPKVFSVMPTTVNLYYFDSLLFATTENEFQVFPVACQPATLFDTIRQNRLTSYYVASTTTAKTDDQHKNESQEQSVINRLLDRQQTPTTAEFEQCFFDWVNLGDKQSADANALLSDYCDGIEFTDGKTATPSISTDLARAVIKRCLTDAQQSANQNTSAQQLMIWPEKVVEFLLRQGAISQRYIDSNTGVLSFLYTRGFHWTALLALRHIPDLTEIDCVQAMKFYLAKPAKELEEILMERSTGTLGGNLRMFSADSMDLQETGTDVFMRCILAGIPFDEVFMTRALKRLSSTELTALLEFAQRWVRRFREYGAMEVERMFQQQQQQQATLLSDNVDAVAWSKIDLPMICQFLSCIIDAHTANLIISPSFHQTLADLKSFIGQETELCNNIETLRGVLLDVYGVKAAADLTAKSAKKKGKATKKTAAGLITAPTALYSIQKVQWW